MMNLYQPSVKLLRKVRVGSRLRRQYDWPQTPLDRLRACSTANQERLQALEQLRDRLDPFELSRRIDRKVERIEKLASRRYGRSAEQEEEGRRNRRGAPVDAADPAERDRAALTGIRRRRSSVTFSMTRRSALRLPSDMLIWLDRRLTPPNRISRLRGGHYGGSVAAVRRDPRRRCPAASSTSGG